ncbi:DMT family transporter [Corynebacterium aquilae]|uniref:Membrane protein n=1 Tax=Corynebacterium aquilae DSM 44791 TaxID=1431546 RepID=A0A1L7CDC7_9CORY|nr:DMT family transporter [Corynebacterium aquilae]APT83852.1 membrane protein [Corynebacterium aquilae DSM 44791]
MHSNFLAAAFAFASAMTIAWGTVVRHRIAEEAPDDGHQAFLSAIRRPLWWAGTSTALIAYGLQIVALGFGTLLVVQPVLVLKLMLTLPMSARWDGRRISRQEMLWATILTVAVGVLVMLGKPSPGLAQPPLSRWIPSLAVGVVALAVLIKYASNQIPREKSLLLGIATGALFGYVAVLSKATVDIFVHFGWWGLATNWEPVTLVLAATLGTVIQQYAFNAGALRNCLPAMTISEPIVAFTLGYLVLGEKFQVQGAGWFAMAAALVAMIAGTVVLSRKGIA